tara:strand:+ start:923 stop:2005 length:1083 start_codon:yes stop_codon:yes gene_type:complete
MKLKICIVFGTRPEIIKTYSVVKECIKRKIDFFTVHSNQHYSENMDKIFFDDLDLPQPDYNLNIGSGLHGNQTGKMLIAIEKILIEEKPTHVLVQGDTNTVLAAALAADKLQIKLGHIEAGLRSYNRRMPEETNRIVTDNISDYLFAPTKKQERILLNEGIEESKIFVVGNTIVDAALANKKKSIKEKGILGNLNLEPKNYFLVTSHRSLNVDIKENLINLIETLGSVAEKYNIPLVFPIHPRTRKKIKEFGINISKQVSLIEPLGFLQFICLEINSKLILTDSGGVQEEACIFGIPCVTLRDETERPETVDVGANIIAGIGKDNVLNAVDKMLSKEISWNNPFGDGRTGKRIIELVSRS